MNLDAFVGGLPETPIQRQAFMRSKADEITANLYPNSEFSKVNHLESLAQYQAEELGLTAQRLVNSEKVADISLQELLEAEDALRKINLLEDAKARKAQKVQWENQNKRLIESMNTPEKGIC